MRMKSKSINSWVTLCSCLLLVGCDQIATRLQGFAADKPKNNILSAPAGTQPISKQEESDVVHAVPHRISGKVPSQLGFGADDTTSSTVRNVEHYESLQADRLKENETRLDRSVEFLVKDNLTVFENIKAAPLVEIQK